MLTKRQSEIIKMLHIEYSNLNEGKFNFLIALENHLY